MPALVLAVTAPVIATPITIDQADDDGDGMGSVWLAQAEAAASRELGDVYGPLAAPVPALEVSATAGAAIIKALENPVLRNAAVGMVAVDLNRGRTIFAYNADKLLNPASVVKLFTAAAALHYLKPEYRFESTAWLQKGQLKSGILNGDLYIKGGGDPTLVTERLWLWVTEMYHLGLQEIKGDLVIVRAFLMPNGSAPASTPKIPTSPIWRRSGRLPSILTRSVCISAPARAQAIRPK